MNTVSIREVKSYAGIARPEPRARMSISEVKSALEKYAKPAKCRGPYYELRVVSIKGFGRMTQFTAFCDQGKERYVIRGPKAMRVCARVKITGADVRLINERR